MEIRLVQFLAIFLSILQSSFVLGCKRCPSFVAGKRNEPHVFNLLRSEVDAATEIWKMDNRPFVEKPPRCQANNPESVDVVNLLAKASMTATNFSSLIPDFQGTLTAILAARDEVPRCFGKVVDFFEQQLSQNISEDAVNAFQSYQKSLSALNEVAKAACPNCNDENCPLSCSDDYIGRVMGLYDQVTVDRDRILKPARNQFWTIYVLRDLCHLQLMFAAKIVALSASIDPISSQVYRDRIVADSFNCMNETYFILDKAMQNVPLAKNDKALGYRAIVWRDVQSWIGDIKKIVGAKDRETTLGINVRQPKHGGKIMIRDAAWPRSEKVQDDDKKKTFLTCPALPNENNVCYYGSCPGNGPALNGSADTNLWSYCIDSVFLIHHDDDTKKDKPIKAHDLVRLTTASEVNSPIFWRTVEWKYAEVDLHKCTALYLEYAVKREIAGVGKRNRFHIEALDWGGRLRQPGEPILDRDWVMFYFDEWPNHQQLWRGRGLHYLEGMIFVA